MQVCDHCGTPVRLEYRQSSGAARWTHDTGPIGRWSCPRTEDDRSIVDDHGVRAMATVSGVEWFEPHRTRQHLLMSEVAS